MGMSHHNNSHKAAQRRGDKHTPVSSSPQGAPVQKGVSLKGSINAQGKPDSTDMKAPPHRKAHRITKKGAASVGGGYYLNPQGRTVDGTTPPPTPPAPPTP